MPFFSWSLACHVGKCRLHHMTCPHVTAVPSYLQANSKPFALLLISGSSTNLAIPCRDLPERSGWICAKEQKCWRRGSNPPGSLSRYQLEDLSFAVSHTCDLDIFEWKSTNQTNLKMWKWQVHFFWCWGLIFPKIATDPRRPESIAVATHGSDTI